MREDHDVDRVEQRRTMVLTRVVAGSSVDGRGGDPARAVGASVWRLKRRFLAEGPAGLVHGNRGRPSARRLDEATGRGSSSSAAAAYAGANDSHLVDLLADEGIVVSRVERPADPAGGGPAQPAPRRPPRHRSRRDRMAQAGSSSRPTAAATTGSTRGPRLTLVGAIDDATGILTGATFRDQEDVAGYLDDPARHDPPPRRAGSPCTTTGTRSSCARGDPADARGAARRPAHADPVRTGPGRARHRLDRRLEPQAKGRIERVWGTLQDRLVTELRLAGATDRESAERGPPPVRAPLQPALRGPAHRRRRPRGARCRPGSAWRPSAASSTAGSSRRDHTSGPGRRSSSCRPTRGRRGYAHRRVDVEIRLDGRLVVWDGTRELLVQPAPADPVQLAGARQRPARPRHGRLRASARVQKPSRQHPWNRVEPGTKLYDQIQRERLSGSPSS